MSSNGNGDEPQVTKPPTPRSRPGRPAASARRAGDAQLENADDAASSRPDARSRPARASRAAGARTAATTVAEPPADDMAATGRPTIPLDPLLRSHHDGANGDAPSNGNGNGNGNGSKSNGATRSTSRPRAKKGDGGGKGKRPVDSPSASVVESAEITETSVVTPSDEAMHDVPEDLASAEPPVAAEHIDAASRDDETTIAAATPLEAAVIDARHGEDWIAHESVVEPVADVSVADPPIDASVVDQSDDVPGTDGPVAEPARVVTPLVRPPLARPPLVQPPFVGSAPVEASAVENVEVDPALPDLDRGGAAIFDQESSTAPVAHDQTDSAAPSRWSLRGLRSKRPASEPEFVVGFAPPEAGDTAPVEVSEHAPLFPGDIGVAPRAGLAARTRRSGSPITSPIPVQPRTSPGTGTGTVMPNGVVAPAPVDGALIQPVGLVPARPPYVRPAPTFDPGLFRTGPVELDPSLDPDRPQRPPRLKPPVRVAPVSRRRRPRLRRVTRIVRHVDPWSVFKVALCFSFVLYGVCLTAGVLLWNVAYTTGTIDNVQRFFESFGWDTFRFNGGELFHNAWIAGLFCAIGLTGLIVLGATLFNLITDLVGGIRVTVLEEEVIERDPAEPRSLLRRRSRHTTSTVPAQGRRDDEEYVDVVRELG